MDIPMAVIVSAIGVILTSIKLKTIWHENRINNFKELYSTLSKSRFIYAYESTMSFIGKYGKEKNSPSAEKAEHCGLGIGYETKYLLAKKEWIVCYNARDVFIKETKQPKYGHWFKYTHMEVTMLPEFFKPYVQNYRRFTGKGMFNGEVIAFKGIIDKGEEGKTTTADRLVMDVYPTDYYDYQNKIGVRELYMVKVIDKEFNRLNNDINRLETYISRIRKKDRVGNLWNKIDPSVMTNRPVVIGACAVCIFRNVRDHDGNSRDYMLFHLRSDKVAEAMNVMSMVPAGSLTRDTSAGERKTYIGMRGKKGIIMNPDLNAAFRYTVIREFEEEILGRSELECAEHYRIPACLDNEKIVQIHFLGMGLDPLNIKMEAMLSMCIDCLEDSDSLCSHIEEMTGMTINNHIFDIEALKELVKHASSEGSIHIIEFKKENVERLMYNDKAMPVFREAMHQIFKEDGTGHFLLQKQSHD